MQSSIFNVLHELFYFSNKIFRYQKRNLCFRWFRNGKNKFIFKIYLSFSKVLMLIFQQVCSKPVKMLFDKLDRGILRDDLILSVVKQAIVENNLPASSAIRMNKKLKFIQIFDFFLFYILPFIILLKKWCSSTNLLGDDDVDAVLVNIETFFIEKSCLVVMIFVLFGFR